MDPVWPSWSKINASSVEAARSWCVAPPGSGDRHAAGGGLRGGRDIWGPLFVRRRASIRDPPGPRDRVRRRLGARPSRGGPVRGRGADRVVDSACAVRRNPVGERRRVTVNAARLPAIRACCAIADRPALAAYATAVHENNVAGRHDRDDLIAAREMGPAFATAASAPDGSSCPGGSTAGGSAREWSTRSRPGCRTCRGPRASPR
jgi:hypothetical protein